MPRVGARSGLASARDRYLSPLAKTAVSGVHERRVAYRVVRRMPSSLLLARKLVSCFDFRELRAWNNRIE